MNVELGLGNRVSRTGFPSPHGGLRHRVAGMTSSCQLNRFRYRVEVGLLVKFWNSSAVKPFTFCCPEMCSSPACKWALPLSTTSQSRY